MPSHPKHQWFSTGEKSQVHQSRRRMVRGPDMIPLGKCMVFWSVFQNKLKIMKKLETFPPAFTHLHRSPLTGREESER